MSDPRWGGLRTGQVGNPRCYGGTEGMKTQELHPTPSTVMGPLECPPLNTGHSAQVTSFGFAVSVGEPWYNKIRGCWISPVGRPLVSVVKLQEGA